MPSNCQRDSPVAYCTTILFYETLPTFCRRGGGIFSLHIWVKLNLFYSYFVFVSWPKLAIIMSIWLAGVQLVVKLLRECSTFYVLNGFHIEREIDTKILGFSKEIEKVLPELFFR